MPTATDLVTDLPADFETFGQAVATSMADLLGGTSGQVLSKASNTDMDFTWVTTDDANAIQNSIVDAKGDLVAASANDTPARLAVGANGETLVADSSTSTGLRYNPQNALANPVINGGMDCWQRGTSFSAAAGAGYTYTADRWCFTSGANQALTITRQATGDTTNLPNIQYALRFQRNSGQTGTATIYHFSSFESVNSIPFAGKTVTMSFYAKAGANYSQSSNGLGCGVNTGTGTDQPYFSMTGSASPLSTTVTLTTTWQRFVVTGTIGATATQLAPWFTFTPTGTAGANDWYEITGVQIDLGTYTASTAPTFRRSQGTIQGELAACQRYYWRQTGKSGNYSIVGNGFGNTSGTQMILQIKNPVELRVEASSIDSSGLLGFNGNSLTAALTSITLDYANQTYSNFKGTVTCDAKAPYALILDIGTTKYIGFSAEL